MALSSPVRLQGQYDSSVAQGKVFTKGKSSSLLIEQINIKNLPFSKDIQTLTFHHREHRLQRPDSKVAQTAYACRTKKTPQCLKLCFYGYSIFSLRWGRYRPWKC